jgi:hypothetical protein
MFPQNLRFGLGGGVKTRLARSQHKRVALSRAYARVPSKVFKDMALKLFPDSKAFYSTTCSQSRRVNAIKANVLLISSRVESTIMDPSMPPRDIGILRRLVRLFMASLIYCTCTHISPDNKTISYFRGRKLHGKQLKVPNGYRGVVVSSTDRILPKGQSLVTVEDNQDAEEVPEVKVMEEQSQFDNIIVWGHEALPEDTADSYVRGMEEWIAFATEVCSTSL